MGLRYTQISIEERCEIARLRATGASVRQIAASLDRAPSTVARELKRNASGTRGYQPRYAEQQARARRWCGSRLERDDGLREGVLSGLKQGWSPEQVAGRLAREAGRSVISHETIYRFIYGQLARKKDYSWRHYLPRAKSKRGWRGRKGGSSASFITLRRPLAERPQAAADRQVPGHWEADLMLFSTYGQAVLALHERYSRLLIAVRPPGKAAAPIATAISSILAPLPSQWRQTLTFDNGTEFARHHELHALGIETFFCDTHAPWQKGGVENAIGRMRRNLPRKTDLADLTDDRFALLVQAYNNTPRKCLGYNTPAEVFWNHVLHFKCESTFPLSREWHPTAAIFVWGHRIIAALPMAQMSANPKLDSLRKILVQERAGGYGDTTVFGGLDRFLQRWTSELEPELGVIGSYADLSAAERETWAEAVLAKSPTSSRVDSVRGNSNAAERRKVSSKKTTGGVALETDVAALKGVAKQTLPKLKRLGVATVGDLVYLFPHRHNDFANTRKIADLVYGEEQTVLVTVFEASETSRGPRRRSTQATLVDETGSVRAIWFNQPYLAKTFRPGRKLMISGQVNVFRGSFVFESPEYELLSGQDELMHTGRLIPVYPTVAGLPQRTLRRVVRRALDVGMPRVIEYLPDESRHRNGLIGLTNAVSQMHYPDSESEWRAARLRLAFDELLLLQLSVIRRKRSWQEGEEGLSLRAPEGVLEGFMESLPFELTSAQRRALDEILADIREPRPMGRLLQGDVGSGKTVVAAAALLVAAANRFQGALMAPTEILAEQHFLSVSRLFTERPSDEGEDGVVSVEADYLERPLKIALLTGSRTKKAKAALHERIAAGEVDIVIGTHAVIQDEVDIPNLALAVVDEQHRFGVMQRASLRGKGKRPHLLAMSATPIPRSLALTVYGDMDSSTIDEMPPGRRGIKTRWVEPDKRNAAYGFIRKEVEKERQAFIVCPLIEESEALQTRAATEEHERLSRDVFPDLKLGLLHGRMPFREKEDVMDRFKSGELDILVATPVIEVGIDIPNATVMMVDGAERFGLAQLHQFRGRVGRGEYQSYCLLLADAPGQEALDRLRIVERVTDGFELAEEDLRLRGPGDYLGTRQSGLPDLKVARITDHDILTLARHEALRILDTDPELSKPENALLAARVTDLSAVIEGEMGS